LDYAFVLVVGLAAGILGGVVGAGSSILLLPVLVYQFGPKQAVPVMAIASIMSNASRVMAWWREVNWRAFAAYSLPGLPCAALGARTLLALPPRFIDAALGLFFLSMIGVRRWLRDHSFHARWWHLSIAGTVIGFLTGIVLSTGPLSVPVFASYGLTKGAFLSTEALSSLALMASKAATFRSLGALPWPQVAQGIVIGASLMLGSFVGKAIVQRMNTETFESLLDLVLLVSGGALLWAARG